MHSPKNKNLYRPISCSFYDKLEARATLGSTCHIPYWDKSRKEQVLKGRIRNLYALQGEAFLEMEGGFTLRLDQLIAVNGRERRNYC